MNPTKCGTFRQRITLTTPATPETFDTFGQPIKSYTAVGTYWAEVRPLAGHEAIVAKQVKAEATHAVSMRYLGLTVINPLDRIQLGSRVFGVVSVRNVEERNRRYELLVQEIQVQGAV